MVEQDLEDLVAEFDLTGDRLISPEEFYNIIMAYYEWWLFTITTMKLYL